MVSASRLTVVLVGVALATGCSVSAVGVRRMDPRTVERFLTANALTANQPSADSLDVLYRLELEESFGESPASTLAELHRFAVTENDSFSLALEREGAGAMAVKHGAPLLFVECRASLAALRERLAARDAEVEELFWQIVADEISRGAPNL